MTEFYSVDDSINTLEKSKFTEEVEDGKRVAVVRTTAKGTFTPTGLKTSIRITTMNVAATATLLPTTPLTGRNSMEIHNLSTTKTLYVGDATVTADRVLGTTSGKEIAPESFWSLDITPDIVLYGIVDSDTAMVKITEVA